MSQWEERFKAAIQSKIAPLEKATAEALQAVQASVPGAPPLTKTQAVLVDALKQQLAATSEVTKSVKKFLGP